MSSSISLYIFTSDGGTGCEFGTENASPSAAPAPAAADNVAQAMAGLTALGYTPAEARDALSRIENKAAPVEELLRLALRNMAMM